MADLKVNDGGTVKTPERIFTVGASNTLYQVNYVVANNASQTPVTVWDAIFTTSRTTTFNTSNTTVTSFNTTFATTRNTTQTTSTSFATGFNTSRSTSRSTTTTFGTSRTTSFNTSRNTTTSYGTSYTTNFNTSRGTSRSTTGGWTGYTYSSATNWFVSVGTGGSSGQVNWGGTQQGVVTGSQTLAQFGSYQYQRGSVYSSSYDSKLNITVTYYYIRRRYNTTTSFTTTFGTSRGTSRTTSKSTTTSFATSRTTSFNTSRSTTTTFNTAIGTSATTSQNTTTTFSTSFNTTNTTSQNTTTTFSTNNNTTVFERVTATGAETEVSSAGAHNIRYWDGSQWTEE